MGRQEADPDRGQVTPGASATRSDCEEESSEALRVRAIRLEYFTVGWNVIEAAVALVAGYLARSIALQGFGLDSIIESASGLMLLWRFQQTKLEQERAESRAVRVVGLTFLALAAYVGYEGVTDLWFRRAPIFSLPGLLLACASLAVMPVLGLSKRRLARKLGSRALAADGLETLLCAYLSATLLIGLILNGWLGWWWADPVAALAMTAFMLREGIEALSD